MLPKKDSVSAKKTHKFPMKSQIFLIFQNVPIMYEWYSIVKDSNADLTVGNWESKIDP